MNKFTLIFIFSIGFLLTGCAGVNSDFECNATTSDSCITMEEANEKAKSVTDTSRPTMGVGVSQNQANTNLPKIAPISDIVISESSSMASIKKGPFEQSNDVNERTTNTTFSTLVSCTVSSCPREQTVTAHRLSEGIAQLWVAPYIDADDVLHKPGHVLFVVKPSTWQQIKSVN